MISFWNSVRLSYPLSTIRLNVRESICLLAVSTASGERLSPSWHL
nr:MAG TPA: hypothetical protein [Caudoviricetes sp.]